MEDLDLLTEKNSDAPHLTGSQELSSQVKDSISGISSVNNSAIADAFDIKFIGHLEARNADESSVMKGHLRHLPLVPGVVQKGLILELLKMSEDTYSGKTTIKTEFGTPIMPGNNIKLSHEIVGLEHEDGKMAVKIEEMPKYACRFQPIFSESQSRDFSEDEMDRLMLQSNAFRFVSGYTMLSRSDDIYAGNVFQGHFNVPHDFRFFDVDKDGEKIVSPYIIEEMAAQIGVLAMSPKTGNVTSVSNELLDSGSALTFNSSICRYSGHPLKPGQQFRLTGQVKEISKRTAAFEYIGFNDEGEAIIAGEICGNIVSVKILKRMFK